MQFTQCMLMAAKAMVVCLSMCTGMQFQGVLVLCECIVVVLGLASGLASVAADIGTGPHVIMHGSTEQRHGMLIIVYMSPAK